MTGEQSPLPASVRANGRHQRWRVAGICLVLAAITFAVFGQTMGFGFVNLDDDTYVYENPVVAGGLSLKGLAWVFTHADCSLYHPLTMLSLMADYQMHGLHAGGYHLTNVLLHTASVILLFLILWQMTGAFWRSAFVAAVFAIHPLRVESVAWVAERKDVLGTFFFMLTLGAYVRYVRLPGSLARYLMVAVAFVLALLSKPTVVTLPFVLLLLDYWPLRRAASAKRLILEKIPLFALAAGACAMTVLAAGKAVASLANVPMPVRLGNALVSYAVYLRQMVWPADLAPLYPQMDKGYPVWTVAVSLLLLALITGGVLAFWRKRPWLLAGWLWYLGMLAPMIGIVQAGGFAHANRMTYLPQIGIYVVLTWLVAEWRVNRVALGCLMTGVLAVLMVCAWKQASYWQDNETLWTHTLDCTTNNYIACNNVGLELLKRGKVDEAITYYQEAVQIKPDYPDARLNLGLELLQMGKLDEAIAQFRLVLRIKPDDAKVYYDLGMALQQKGNMSEALANFQQALQIEPSDPTAQNNLAWLLATCPEASLRNGRKAVELAQKANEVTGGKNPLILDTLAAAFAETGQFSEAVETAQHALRLAEAQSNACLAGQLQSEIKLYQAGRPCHVAEQTR